MPIGSLAKSQRRFAALIAAAAALLPMATFGQSRYGYEPRRGAMTQGAVQALYTSPAQSGMAVPSPYVDGYGNTMIAPAGYNEPCGPYCEGGPACGPCGPDGMAPMPRGGFNGPFPMGAGGTEPPVGYDLMSDTGIEGQLIDQRGPHYWDIRAETVFLRRDEGFEKQITFTSFNVGNQPVLTSSDLNCDNANFQARLQQFSPQGLLTGSQSSNFCDPNWGFRVMGRYDICPLSVVEFGYMGIYSWDAHATVIDASNNLYSLFSLAAPGVPPFGASPAGVTNPGGPNPFSERAHQHTISLESDLQTAEISYRRYWLGYIPRVSGTLLAGFRYTRVTDEFEFETLGSEPLPQTTGPLAALDYNEDCENNLAGIQAGGDIWVSLWQGVRIGAEGKAGIYDNHSVLRNRITTTPHTTAPPETFEEFKNDHAAFIGEASFDVVFDIFPSLSLRAGYEMLFLNSLVLAGDNFNQISPYENQGPRVPFFEDDGELFYHGGHFGVEYIW